MEVYRTNDVLDALKISRMTLREYEKRGIIPLPDLNARPRFYSKERFEKVVETVEEIRRDPLPKGYFIIKGNGGTLQIRKLCGNQHEKS